MREILLIPYDHRLHLDPLYRMMMTPDEQALFMSSGRCNSLKEFDGWIQDRLRHTYQEFFMIGYPEENSVIGFLYASDMRIKDGHCKMGVYIVPSKRDIGVGAQATIVFLNYLFKFNPLRKVYTEVYDYNTASIQNHIDAGFQEEGLLKGYRYFDGKYHDLHIFSIDRQYFETTLAPLLKEHQRKR